ncbi:MAG: acyl--CoA ligase [Anaerolineales bacterium]|nr:acyl--CoA ligase [Anaerolineales bacterium]
MSFSLETLLVGLYLRRFRVPRDLLRVASRRYADRTALVSVRGALTFAQLADRVWRLADALAQAGVRRGDRIGYIASGGQDQIEILLASYELGTVLTGFTPVHALDVIRAALTDAPPKVFFYDGEARPDLETLLEQAFPGTVGVGHLDALEALIARGRPTPSREPVSPDDLSGLGFTSGTTGRPKALTVTQGVWLTSLRLSVLNVRVKLGGHDVALPGMPISGAGGGLILPSLAGGATLVIPQDYRTPSLLEAIEAQRVTRLFVTPSTLIDLLDWPDLDRRDLSSLRNIIYGTAPTPAAKVEEAVRRFGAILQQGYGMAEVLPPVSLLQMEAHGHGHQPAPRAVLRSVGHVVPQARVRVVSADGQVLEANRVGEVEVKSPTVFRGYWRQPDLTAAAFRDGYLRTRDYGYFDGEGRLVILDRDVDVITRGDRRLYPREVEEVVHEHPAVKEACLVADGSGRLVLVVSLRRAWRDRSLVEFRQDLGDFLRVRLPDWQVPERIQVLPELPRSYLNKVLRREIRAALETPEGAIA